MDAPLRSIQDHARAKEGSLRSTKGDLRPTKSLLRSTENPLVPKKLSDQNRALSGRQKTTRRGVLRPIRGYLRPTKDALRLIQNFFKSNSVTNIDKGPSQDPFSFGSTRPSHTDESWAERGSSHTDGRPPSAGNLDRWNTLSDRERTLSGYF